MQAGWAAQPGLSNVPSRGKVTRSDLYPLCQKSQSDRSAKRAPALFLEKRPMKAQGRTPATLKRMNGANRGFILLSVLVGLAVCVPLLDVYIVRELLLFVACAALLVFSAANLALLGILFHAVARSLFQSARQAKTGIARQAEAHAEHLVGSLAASPMISTEARTRHG